MNLAVWRGLRWWIYLRRRRWPPESMPDRVWYFAFGSNMNDRLFRQRRHMTPLETRIGRLHDYRLCFTVTGGQRPGISAPANIVEAPGQAVHGVLYLLPLRNFVRLDASEGRQYAYLWAEVVDEAGLVVRAVTYTVAYPAPEGRPSLAYLSLIREAARQRELPADYVAFLDQVDAAG